MNVFESLKKLGTNLNEEERNSCLDELNKKLVSDADVLEAYIRMLFSLPIKKNLIKNMNIKEEELFCEIDVHSYYDDNSEKKIALFVAFLQEYDNHNDDLEQKILDDIVYTIKEMGINIIINDINVNHLQWIDS